MVVLINAKIVTADKVIDGHIVIDKNGRIYEVCTGKYHGNKAKIIDAQGKYVLPGLIEVHGHMREPGLSHKGTVETETMAAIAGGVTTILDMPNTKPPTITKKLLEEKQNDIYPERSYTDYAFLFGAAGGAEKKSYLKELSKVRRGEIAGIKVFTAGHETAPSSVTNLGDLADLFEIFGRRKIPVCVHAEKQELLDRKTQVLKNQGRVDPRAWSEARDKEVVSVACKEVLKIAKRFKNKVYMLHLSTEEELEAVEQAKRSGVNVIAEVATYQFLFNTEDYKKFGNLIKVSPALRSRQTQKKLWQALDDGRIDTICSEHTPHTLGEKKGDVWTAPSGMPGIQESLPALVTKWILSFGGDNIERGLQTFAEHMSKNIANFFSLNTKGEIKQGKDADLVVINTNKKWYVNKKDLFTKCGWSVHEGRGLCGRPEMTILRGNVVYLDGKITGNAQGQWLITNE